MSRAKPQPGLQTITLREGDEVTAQWWEASAQSTSVAWFLPDSPVPFGRCRLNGLVLVDLATMRERCSCSATHAAQAAHEEAS